MNTVRVLCVRVILFDLQFYKVLNVLTFPKLASFLVRFQCCLFSWGIKRAGNAQSTFPRSWSQGAATFCRKSRCSLACQRLYGPVWDFSGLCDFEYATQPQGLARCMRPWCRPAGCGYVGQGDCWDRPNQCWIKEPGSEYGQSHEAAGKGSQAERIRTCL